MKYEKPEITLAVSASDAIQSGCGPKGEHIADKCDDLSVSSAYSADE